jgi:hypothetical protein
MGGRRRWGRVASGSRGGHSGHQRPCRSLKYPRRVRHLSGRHVPGQFQGACGGSPFPTHFAAVLDPSRILVGSQSNFGAPLLTGVGQEGSFLSIDPSGPGILSIPSNFARSGGQASALNGGVQIFAANSADWLNSINNPNAYTKQYTGVSNPIGPSNNYAFGRL